MPYRSLVYTVLRKNLLGAGILAATVIVTMFQINNASKQAHHIAQTTLPQNNMLRELEQSVHDMHLAAKLFLSNPTSQATFNHFRQSHDDALQKTSTCLAGKDSLKPTTLWLTVSELNAQLNILASQMEQVQKRNYAVTIAKNNLDINKNDCWKATDALLKTNGIESTTVQKIFQAMQIRSLDETKKNAQQTQADFKFIQQTLKWCATNVTDAPTALLLLHLKTLFENYQQLYNDYAHNAHMLEMSQQSCFLTLETLSIQAQALSNLRTNLIYTPLRTLSHTLQRYVKVDNYVVLLAFLALGTCLTLTFLWLHGMFSKLLKDFDKINAGDLTINIEAPQEDEMGILAASTHKIKEQLRNLVKGISKSSLQFANIGRLLVSTANDFYAHSSKFSQNISLFSSTSRQHHAATERLLQNVQSAQFVAAEAQQAIANHGTFTKNGLKYSEKIDSSIKIIQDKAKNVDNIVRNLKNGIINIAEIMDITRKLADQTHLLALNVTIEASESEYGGFSIIANEVKALAIHNTQAAQQIEHYVQSVQSTVETFAHTIRDIDAVVTQYTETGTEFLSFTRVENERAFDAEQKIKAIAEIVQLLNEDAQQLKQQNDHLSATLDFIQTTADQRAYTFKLAKENGETLIESSKNFEQIALKFRI